jgi:hyaluronoglucosaminidase
VALRDIVASDRDLPAFAMFADTVRSSCLSLDDAPELVAVLERFALLLHLGRDRDAAETLADYAARALAAAEHLLGGGVVNRTLVAEAEPWIRSFRLGALALQRIAELAAEGRLDDAASTDLVGLRDQLIAARRRVFGDALDMALTDLVAPPVPRTTDRTVPSPKEAAP